MESEEKNDKIAAARNDFNHQLYEYERAETVDDLVNALMFTANSLKLKQ